MSLQKLLLVDDEASIRESLSEFLGGLEYELSQAASEDEAFELACRIRPAVVVSDLNLGNGGSGLSLFSRLKKDLAGGDEPCCILMTGFGTVENAVEAIRLGVDDYLLKPVKLPELKSAVQSGMSRKAFRDSSPLNPAAALADRFFHEVSSPLTVVRACLDMFAEGRFGPLTELQEKKMEIGRRKMAEVLGVLRGFHSHIEPKGPAGLHEPLDTEALFRHVQQDFFLDFERRGVNVVICLPGPLPPALAERRQAVMVLEALMGNCLSLARFGMTLKVRWVRQQDSLGLQLQLAPWEQAGDERGFPVFSSALLEAAGLALHTEPNHGTATLVFLRLPEL